MLHSPPPPIPRCDCCGLSTNPHMGENCPRCGYPISVQKEEQFLEHWIRDLQRVTTYGGAQATVTNLLQRYRMRLGVLRQQKYAVAEQPNSPTIASPEPVAQSPVQNAPSAPKLPANVSAAPTMINSTNVSSVAPASPIQSGRPAARRIFSLQSFLAEQPINIVSSLGAFLILIGSLSFVVTTTNLFLSFLVVLIVHAIFAAVGFVFSRFQSFRFIARVYTAIFALLVPLVGFSGYRLVSDHLVQIPASTVVAIAAAYAAIVYAVLAISQQFRPFGYLSVVALALADLAVAFSLHLSYWWWPAMLMPLAFASLVSAQRISPRPFSGTAAVLREPVRALLYACIAVLISGVLCTSVYSLSLDVFVRPSNEVRFSIASMTLLLLTWTCLFLWLTKHVKWLSVVPYQFLGCVIAFAYVFEFHQVGYALAFTAVAIFYHGLSLFTRQFLQRFSSLRVHTEGIVLALVSLVPFIVSPLLPLQLFSYAWPYIASSTHFSMTGETIPGLAAVLIGFVLTISILFRHTGPRKTPDSAQTAWRWLALLSGFLLTWAYSLLVLSLHVAPVWCFFGLTLVFVVAAVGVRRGINASWANPLDILTLCEVALTLALSPGQNLDSILSLLLFFTTLSYCVVLYQRRQNWLFLPLVFLACAMPLLLVRPRVMLSISALLPLVCVLVHLFVTRRVPRVSTTANTSPNLAAILASTFVWEWPLLLIGLLCGATVCLTDSITPVSTVQIWFGVTFPVALEMAGLSLIWYICAALVRVKWWLVFVVGFAVAGLLLPNNSFWALACLAPIAALLALGISRLTDKVWALPLYTVAVLAAVMMGLAGYGRAGQGGQLSAATWILLGFSALIYLIGVIEDISLFLWLAPFFATWSVYDSALLSDLYRPPVVALLCAASGVSIGCLKFATKFCTLKKYTLLRFALPFYTTALAAAILTGAYGTLDGINNPFYGAIPGALLVYAVVAYGVLLFERQPRWLLLVAAFSIWGTLLAVQTTAYYVLGIGLMAGLIGLILSRMVHLQASNPTTTPLQNGLVKLTWAWPWYATMLVAAALIGAWQMLPMAQQPVVGFVEYALFTFIVLTFIVMLVERRPEMLLFPAILAAWAISQIHWNLWQQMIAYSVLCVLIFATRYIWRVLRSATQGLSPTVLHSVLGLGGQVCVVFAIIAQGGLFAETGPLAHVGAGSLFVLAALLFWYGLMQPVKLQWSNYGAGLLLSLVVSWELSAFRQTHLDWLTLAPATYLIVIAPFLSRNQSVLQHHRVGQLCSILGSALLLLPSLWLSFNQDNLRPTLILAGESLVLLLLGVGTRVRFFILSGAGLIVVSAMHALFLPSLGIPPSLALTIMGVTLLIIATALSLARHRLQAVWTQLD